jgi:hypothetical protein
MTSNIEADADGVKTAADLRRLMAEVSKQLGKVQALPIVEGALGFDDFTGKMRRPVELDPSQIAAACEKLQAVIAAPADNVILSPDKDADKPSMGTLKKLSQERKKVFEDSLAFADFEADSGGALPPLTVVAQLRGTRAQSIADLCNRFVWCTGIERWIDRAEPSTQWKSTQLDSEYNVLVRKGSLSKELHGGRRIMRFKRVAFIPGKPEFYGETYNTWRPSLIVPKQGDTSLWDAHLKWLVADKADRDRLLNWLAWVYQHQDLKPNHALLLVGETFGTGKSFVARVMEQLLGLDNVQRPKNSSLSGEFNTWAASCKLAIIEELMQMGRKEVEGMLRDLITEPRIEVNTKGVIAYLIDSYLALMAVSNHPDALPLKPGDRRWLVIESLVSVEDKTKKIAEGYFAKLMPIVDKDKPDLDALAAIAYQLSTRPLGKYDARGEAPMTDAKATMIDLGRTPLQSWLNDERQNDPFTRRVVNVREIVEQIPPSVIREQSSRMAEMTIAKFLKRELRGVNIGDHRIGGRVVKLWAINGVKLTGDGRRVQAIDGKAVAAVYTADMGRIKAVEEAVDDFGALADDFGEGA